MDEKFFDQLGKLSEIRENLYSVKGERHAAVADYIAGASTSIFSLARLCLHALERIDPQNEEGSKILLGKAEAVVSISNLIRLDLARLAHLLEPEFPGLSKDCSTIYGEQTKIGK